MLKQTYMGLFKKKKIGKTMGTRGRYRPALKPAAAARRRKAKKMDKIRRNAEKKIFKSRGTSKRMKKILRPFILIAIGIVLYLIGHLLFISDIFIIKEVQLETEALLVKDETEPYNYIKNFDGTNILLLDEFEEENYLQTTYQQYKTINIKKSLPSTLIIEVEPYENAANLITTVDGFYKKFIINEFGIAIDPDTEDPSLPYIYLESDSIVLEGKQAIEPEVLKFIEEAIEDYENKFGMQILDITYYKIAREVHLRTERYFDVWLDTQMTVDEQLTKLKLALPSLNIYEEEIQYIDLRISGQTGDKVIYK